MDKKTHNTGPVAVIELSGRFDAYSSPEVAEWFKSAPECKIVVNLRGVNFVDSTALATLVQGMKHSRQNNGDLRLAEIQQPVRVILELTRLDRAFSIYATETEAVDSFAS